MLLESSRFVELNKIGEGAFGVVRKGIDTFTGEPVAIKQVFLQTSYDPRQSKSDQTEFISAQIIREIHSLQQLNGHPNVLKMIGVYTKVENPHSLQVVSELMLIDLDQVLKSVGRPLFEKEIKTLMLMFLRGLSYVHECSIIHRDIKPSNLFIDRNGILKIGDFGLSRIYDEKYSGNFTSQVATRWYKAPELFYGSQIYGTEIDIWSAGCIFAEMFTMTPCFRGESDIDQLYQIARVLGNLTPNVWSDMKQLPHYDKIIFEEIKPIKISKMISHAPPQAIALIDQLLALNPTKRISAREALCSPYFFSEPLPTHPSKLPLQLKQNERRIDR